MAVCSADLIKPLEKVNLLNFEVSGIHSYNCDLRLSVCYLMSVFFMQLFHDLLSFLLLPSSSISGANLRHPTSGVPRNFVRGGG